MRLSPYTVQRATVVRRRCIRHDIKHHSTGASAGAFHDTKSVSLLQSAAYLREKGPARTRFAPSPTGNLHLGSLRTALFNYLIAKATGGQFLLRIEDTDQTRTIPGAADRLFRDLEWAGIEWDEGPNVGGPYGPYIQSQRTAIYREHVHRLLPTGKAYRCFCTAERLRSLAEFRANLGLPADYDRRCANLPKEQSEDRASKGEAHVVRLKSLESPLGHTDLVYGTSYPRPTPLLHGYDDPILLKSDGFPTYHLANVVDDHLMRITLVIRGAEWLSSTSKHLAIYDAFKWRPPEFAHVGLLLDNNRQKLSKRTGAVDIEPWRKEGIFPESITNFLALQGWSHQETQDVMSMQDLIRNASLKFTRGDTVVSFEKLWFLQKRHAARYAALEATQKPTKPSYDLRELATKPIVQLLDKREDLTIYASIPEEGPAREDYVHSIVLLDATSYNTPNGFIQRNILFFTPPTIEQLRSERPSLRLHKVPPEVNSRPASELFPTLFSALAEIPAENWKTPKIKSRIAWMVEQGSTLGFEEAGETLSLAPVLKKAWSKLIHRYLRWAMCAGKPGPDGAETACVLGRDEVLRRLELASTVLAEVSVEGGERKDV